MGHMKLTQMKARPAAQEHFSGNESRKWQAYAAITQ
jgi:hypothetical protein